MPFDLEIQLRVGQDWKTTEQQQRSIESLAWTVAEWSKQNQGNHTYNYCNDRNRKRSNHKAIENECCELRRIRLTQRRKMRR